MSRKEALEAELEVVALEDELLRLKGLKKPDQEKLRQVKLDLREARRKYRSADPDGGTANPGTIQAKTGVNQ